MDRREFLRRVAKLNVWSANGERAPHKPLLMLLALGRLQRGEARLALFEEIEEPLTSLLIRFGRPRKTQHPEYPFVYLRNDGLWELLGSQELPQAVSDKVTKGALKQGRVKGGFPRSVERLLTGAPELVSNAAQMLLQGHFADSLHDDIRDAVGLRAEWVVRDAAPTTRDPNFRPAVLRAYERRCAVCDYDIRLGEELLGLEAAHIKWHAAGGPDDVSNGLALCGFHHKAFDRGAWSLDPRNHGFRILVSSEAHGQSAALRWLRDYHGAKLRRPLTGFGGPLPGHVAWHRRQVFRPPPLTAP